MPRSKRATSRKRKKASAAKPKKAATSRVARSRVARASFRDLIDAKRLAAERFLAPPERARIPEAQRAGSPYGVDPRPLENVVGVGAGWRRKEGRHPAHWCVRFYVARKLPESAIPPEHRLPPRIEGFPTAVIETGVFVARRASPPDPRKRLRPARPGCSIGFLATGERASIRMAGTLGAVARMKGVLGILSNNHVLADENRLPIGSAIYQPGPLDGANPAKDELARLERFVPLDVAEPNRVDAAFARVLDERAVNARVLGRVGVLKSASPAEAAENMKVEKFGRTTGYTQGHVVDVSADVRVRYDRGELVFLDQFLVVGEDDDFSQGGDSGSLIVEIASKSPVGLLFAGSSSHTIVHPIAPVLEALDLELVT